MDHVHVTFTRAEYAALLEFLQENRPTLVQGRRYPTPHLQDFKDAIETLESASHRRQRVSA